ncbi:hydroxyacid dehydrogenase [Phytoactinopolyspora halotolerans]|uniref:Hydroxyacid dehydrogenase n=1 Tax=Phytoactinopolyspora halotolerans TaxID=1981512 RepID=A0A6L9SDS7_9ACTN|nr:hydroxyacid dehydrogenase [Phytoactinopolyspora halotolerans]NEE02708.1 hydroxyacid dehydrogenase [Phytoactinopolyspora halotolerans]
MADRPPALFVMRPDLPPLLFPRDTTMQRLRELVSIGEPAVGARFDDPGLAGVLSSVEILITGWECPPLDTDALRAMPRLRAVLHAAGSVKGHLTREFWERGIPVSSAASANAMPVAEYTLAAILWAGKGLFGLRERYRAERRFTIGELVDGVGNFRRKVGIVGASRIGRRVIELLRRFDVEIYLTDPYLDADSADALGATLVDLETMLAECDIVSLHAPETPETRHLLDDKRLKLLRDGATVINTARGALIDTDALIPHLVDGRISAVLDVTDPEPLPADSILFVLPNVVLTPHVAGSHGNELVRLGETVVAELDRLISGRPFHHEVHLSQLDRQA